MTAMDPLQLPPLDAKAQSRLTNAPGDPQREQSWQREMEQAQAAAWLRHGALGRKTLTAFANPGRWSTVQAFDAREASGTEAETGGGSMRRDMERIGKTLEELPSTGQRSDGNAEPEVLPGHGAKETAAVQVLVHKLAVFGIAFQDPTAGQSQAAPFPASGLAQVASREALSAAPLMQSRASPSNPVTVPSLQSASPTLVSPALAGNTPFATGPFTEAPGGRAVSSSHTAGQAAPPAPAIRIHADWSTDGVRLWLGLDAALAEQIGAIVQQVRRCMAGQGIRILSLACNGRPVEPQEIIAAEYEDIQLLLEEKVWPSVR